MSDTGQSPHHPFEYRVSPPTRPAAWSVCHHLSSLVITAGLDAISEPGSDGLLALTSGQLKHQRNCFVGAGAMTIRSTSSGSPSASGRGRSLLTQSRPGSEAVTNVGRPVVTIVPTARTLFERVEVPATSRDHREGGGAEQAIGGDASRRAPAHCAIRQRRRAARIWETVEDHPGGGRASGGEERDSRSRRRIIAGCRARRWLRLGMPSAREKLDRQDDDRPKDNNLKCDGNYEQPHHYGRQKTDQHHQRRCIPRQKVEDSTSDSKCA